MRGPPLAPQDPSGALPQLMVGATQTCLSVGDVPPSPRGLTCEHNM